MTRWTHGETTVAFLIERGRLETIGVTDLVTASESAIARARKRLGTAESALEGSDVEGAYVAAYDAYRIAAEALLVRQGLLATGGEGSHVTLEDATSAQFAHQLPTYRKATFERFRKTRHSAQYFDPSAPPLERADAQWALEISHSAVDGAAEILRAESLDRFEE